MWPRQRRSFDLVVNQHRPAPQVKAIVSAVDDVGRPSVTVCFGQAKQSASAFCIATLMVGRDACLAQIIGLGDIYMARQPTPPGVGRVVRVRRHGRQLIGL
jgi:hypothetical protein